MVPTASPASETQAMPAAYAELVDAIAAGRGGRGRAGSAWTTQRAIVLGYAAQGLLRVRIGGLLGVSPQWVTQLREDGCDAVLRGALPSAEADRACGERWRRCCGQGDAAACARVVGTISELPMNE